MQKKSGEVIESRLKETPIAIIGMAGLFPEAKNLQEYWENIINKVDCIIDVPESHWNIADYYDPDKSAPDKSYSKRAGFIPDIDFDPLEFGLPPNILEVIDVSQLLSLVVAKDLLADAGYGDKEFDREHTGVILGVVAGQELNIPLISRLQEPVWRKVLQSSGVSESDIVVLVEKMKKAYVRWEENSFPGRLDNVIAGRVANRFDLGGTNCVVDAACAGSLAATKMAINDLLDGRANMMIAGGVDTDNSPSMFLNFSKTPAFTTDEIAKPFDEDSKGIMMGEGIGMFLLKRLSDAERDNDRIYATIRGIGSSSDGRFKSIYAPRASGQTIAINRAYEDAGFDKSTVSLIEAHGTGTKAGDAAEFGGLKGAFDSGKHQKQKIALGTVKSQIGHTKSTAGAASMIKTALALYHKVLPPTCNVDTPNPEMEIEDSSFYLNTLTRPWINQSSVPRRAGVSSFGFGGTNFHFVLEEHKPEAPEKRIHSITRTFILSGETPEQLWGTCKNWITRLETDTGEFHQFVQEAQNSKIPEKHARVGFAAKTAAEVIKMLDMAVKFAVTQPDAEKWSNPMGVFYRNSAVAKDVKVVALFSGQGSQFVNMGRDLAYNFPVIAESFVNMDRALENAPDKSVTGAVYPKPTFTDDALKAQEEKLRQGQFIQPAIGAFSMGLFKLLTSMGFKPDITAGHSFGELAALWGAGIMSDEDYCKLAGERGLAMDSSADADFDAGGMVAVMGDVSNIDELIKPFDKVSVANYNSSQQVVLSGPKKTVRQAHDALEAQGFNTVLLQVSAAFHSPLIAHAREPFAKSIDAVQFHNPTTTVYSNATADPYPADTKIIKDKLKDQILQTVNFVEEIKNINKAGGGIFIEFGPRGVLTKLVTDILKDKDHVAVALNATPKKSSEILFFEALAQICVAGIPLELKDPAQPEPVKPSVAKKGMSIKLNGANYVSEPTKKAFADALKDGHRLAGSQTPALPTAPPQVAAPATTPAPMANKAAPQQAISNQGNGNNNMDQSEWLKYQSSTVQVHDQYLKNQQEYANTFFQLMQQQVDVYGKNNQPVPENITQGMSQFQQFQSETLQVHHTYLNGQIDFSRSAYQFISGQPFTAGPVQTSMEGPTIPVSPSVPAPAPVSAAPVQAVTPPPAPVAPAAPVSAGVDMTRVQENLLAVVQEKTGYPMEMLDLNMDMEADLGIDSIKRVEILSGIKAKTPDLPALNQADLVKTRTLTEIVEYIKSKAGTSNTTAPAAATATDAGVDMARVQENLLAVVQEKTGYPMEMLDLNMDMEADLGIDSIKRVEILSGIKSKTPDLPALNQADLVKTRTLAEIVEYIKSKAGAAPAAAITTTIPSGGVSGGDVKNILMEVVQEKTGYPLEMLDVAMDMEADLGIDSIKRVEILSAIRKKSPGLPELKAGNLAVLRTLGQIIDYINERMDGVAAEPIAAVAAPKKKVIN